MGREQKDKASIIQKTVAKSREAVKHRRYRAVNEHTEIPVIQKTGSGSGKAVQMEGYRAVNEQIDIPVIRSTGSDQVHVHCVHSAKDKDSMLRCPDYWLAQNTDGMGGFGSGRVL